MGEAPGTRLPPDAARQRPAATHLGGSNCHTLGTPETDYRQVAGEPPPRVNRGGGLSIPGSEGCVWRAGSSVLLTVDG